MQVPVLNGFLENDLSGVPFKDQTRKRKIIAHLSNKEQTTLTELSDLLNISIPKTTELISVLETEGLVYVSGRRSEGPGRKASVYALASNSLFFLGLEIRKYSINLGIMGFDRKMVLEEKNLPFHYENADESIAFIISLLEAFIEKANIPVSKIGGIGCSISGRVNVHTSEIITFYHFGQAPLKQVLEQRFGIPVFLDNDSRTLAYGEYHFGKRNGEPEVLVLNLDYGLALGIFVRGKPVYGVSGYAGELGHIPMFENEKICYCGKKGCLETEASGRVLIENIVYAITHGSGSILESVLMEKQMLELEDIVAAVHKGDNLAITEVDKIASKLGRGLAVTINLFNPRLIIIAGALSAIGDALLLPIKSFILRHSLSVVSNDTLVELSELGEKAGLPGTCLLVRDKILGLV